MFCLLFTLSLSTMPPFTEWTIYVSWVRQYRLSDRMRNIEQYCFISKLKSRRQ